ncbi:MAG: hypothetical protein KKD17_04585 [Nanoarchaeota archaeon]|nr:hypothetical protein [Nanoarchaeota archaeon]
MKLIYLGILLCVILSCFAAAQARPISNTLTVSPTLATAAPPCKSTEQLNREMEACKSQGMAYTTYVGQDSCKGVACVKDTDTCPSDAEVMRMSANCPENYGLTTDQNGCKIRYCLRPCPDEDELDRLVANCPNNYVTTTDQHGCKIRQCRTTTTCPTAEEAMKRVANCPNAYSWTTDQQGCKVPYCTTTSTCPTEEEAMKKVANCPDAYSWTTDQQGCKVPYCTPTTMCPSDVEEQIKKCKAAQLDYEVYGDQNGCKQVRCRERERVTCEKYVSNGCVIFSCNDGYVLNLCDYCQPTCRVYTDNNGCTVKDCGNGQTSRACPEAAGSVAPVPQVTTATQIVTEAPTTATAPAQPQESTLAAFLKCIEDKTKEGASIDDDPTWAQCRTEHRLSGEPEAMAARLQKCIIIEKEGAAEIDDEVTWAKCKKQYITGEGATGLSPQPDAPGVSTEGSAAPKGFMAWLKGIFK